MTSLSRPLTAKQARFVAEYQVDLNATQAAIRAGYSEKTAASIGSENLKKPEIASAITQAQVEVIEAVTNDAKGSVAWIVEMATEVVSRALNAVPVTRMERGKVVTVEGEWTCNLSAATPALALLAKRHPEFRDAPLVDNSQHVHLPEGLTVEELRALASGR